MRCMKITCEDEDSDSDGGDMVDNYRLRKHISNEPNIDNNQQTFLPFISTHPSPLQASLPCWRPCFESLQLKRSYSTQKSKIRPPLKRKLFQVTSFEIYSRFVFRKWWPLESFNMAPFLMHRMHCILLWILTISHSLMSFFDHNHYLQKVVCTPLHNCKRENFLVISICHNKFSRNFFCFLSLAELGSTEKILK